MFNNGFCIFFLLIICLLASNVFGSFSTSTADITVLRSPNNQADYLIISTDSFQSATSPLVAHRENQGLTVRFADISQIYQEFGDSLANAKKIRHFVSYALEFWQSPRPKYLLIVGDTEIIPSYKLASSLVSMGEDSVSIDEWFSINQYDTDNVTDIAIGRIPASNLNQAELAISRTLFFENNLVLGDYTQDYLVLADSFDVNSQIFEDMANQFIDIIEPYNFRISRIDIRKTSMYYGIPGDFISQINDGVLFVNYLGFGNEKIWSRDTFFTVNDVDSLENNDLPCIVMTTAGSQNFDAEDDNTIVEKLLFNPSGGAIAVFASSGLCFLSSANTIFLNLNEYLLDNPDTTLGTAILQVKKNYNPAIPPDNSLRRFTLLGDPALKFPADFLSGLNTPRDNTIHAFRLKQNYPNPFNPSTIIQFDLPQASKVSLKIFNILGEEVATLVSDRLSAGSYSYDWDASNLASGVYIYRLEAEGFVQTRKMILMK